MAQRKKIPARNNGKHPGGRPIEYTDERLSSLAKEMLVWFKKKKNWWLKDFAIKNNLCWRSLLQMAEHHQELSDAIELCKEIQESKLVRKGYQAYADRHTAFIMKNICGWRDVQDMKLSAPEGFEITIGKSKEKTKN